MRRAVQRGAVLALRARPPLGQGHRLAFAGSGCALPLALATGSLRNAAPHPHCCRAGVPAVCARPQGHLPPHLRKLIDRERLGLELAHSLPLAAAGLHLLPHELHIASPASPFRHRQQPTAHNPACLPACLQVKPTQFGVVDRNTLFVAFEGRATEHTPLFKVHNGRRGSAGGEQRCLSGSLGGVVAATLVVLLTKAGPLFSILCCGADHRSPNPHARCCFHLLLA